MTTRTFVLALLVASSGVASAGFYLPAPVTISYGTSYVAAEGTVYSARNSSDPYMNIGCSVYVLSTGYLTFCAAQDATGRFFACSNSNNDAFVRTAAMIGPLSKIRFQAANGATGTCTAITVTNSSMYAPPG